jgi:hypothetical protein
MNPSLIEHLRSFIDKDVLVQLRGVDRPVGPGPLTVVPGVDGADIFRIMAITPVGHEGGRPQLIKLGYVFAPEDVVVIIEPPPVASASDLATPGGNGTRTPGGIVIPGRG